MVGRRVLQGSRRRDGSSRRGKEMGTAGWLAQSLETGTVTGRSRSKRSEANDWPMIGNQWPLRAAAECSTPLACCADTQAAAAAVGGHQPGSQVRSRLKSPGARIPNPNPQVSESTESESAGLGIHGIRIQRSRNPRNPNPKVSESTESESKGPGIHRIGINWASNPRRSESGGLQIQIILLVLQSGG